MALSTVETVLMGLFDKVACAKAAARLVVPGGVSYWTRVDGAADMTFENRVKGLVATAYDVANTDPPLGEASASKNFWSLIEQYAKQDMGFGSFDAYLTSLRWRVDAKTASVLASGGITVSAANTAGDADGGATAPGLSLGNLTQSGAIAGADDIALTSSVSPIIGRVTVKGVTDWVVTATLKRLVGTTVNVAATVVGSGTGGVAGDVYIFGKQAVGAAGAAAAQKVIPCAATAQFLAGEYVLLTQWSGVAPNEVWLEQEVCLVDTVTLNTSLTVHTNLLHTYTSAGFVYPLYRGVTAASGTGGSASDRLYFYPGADRRLKQ